ncbi:hypothetical protein [Skermania piniformis]|uniref:DUF8175 domain-containing protein n=1 Tax=Skermania pinensis TaxID=39122 RepID=A0ABX8SEN3_9ACTN|nr:hypothetical protein [Skermania piniformis]QXQ15424.1 hypothetical protein KV203_09020 [Skermania piniformis]
MSSRRDSPPRERVSFGLVASAAALALIVVAGVFAFVQMRGSDASPAPSGQSASPPAVGPAGGAGFGAADVDLFGRRVDVPDNPAGQPLAQTPGTQKRPTDSDWLTAAPKGMDGPGGWQRVYGVSVPFSSSDGPARIDGGLAVGYAHTPQGAALAAAQISYRMNARPADRDLYARQVGVAPQQLAQFDRLVSDNKLPAQQPEKVTRFLIASDAFQVESYADDMAIVRLAARGPTVEGRQTWLATRLVTVWQDGDWKLKPVTGRPQTETLTSLIGWTPW